MNKQEGINKGIDNILDDWFGSQLSREKIITLRKRLVVFLYGQGVVVKVNRELPSIVDGRDEFRTGLAYREEILRAGCGFFEPLIEEK